FGLQTEIEILPGESAYEFELLQTKVSEDLIPDGPLEEDAVLTVAKCIWRKKRFQRFLTARRIAAAFDPDHKAYDEVMALNAFFSLLVGQTDEDEINRSLERLGGYLAQDLRKRCPRRKFAKTKAWIDAMKREAMKMRNREQRFGSPPDE